MAKLSAAAEIVRKTDYDRYIATLFTPPKLRERLFCLYALNAEIAKLPFSVSEPTIGLIRLAWWREALEEILGNRPRKHELVAELYAEHMHKPLPITELQELLDGYEADIENPVTESLDELKTRIRNTTGKLNQIILKELGANEDAEKLSLGWGLLGVWRMVKSGKEALPQDVSLLKTIATEAKQALVEAKVKTKLLRIQKVIAQYELTTHHPHRGLGYYLAILRAAFL